jgi:hypothetical protein
MGNGSVIYTDAQGHGHQQKQSHNADTAVVSPCMESYSYRQHFLEAK